MKNLLIILFVFAATALQAGNGLTVTQKYVAGASGQNIMVTWYVTASQCKMKMLFSDKDLNTNTFFIPDVAGGQLLTYSDGPVPVGVQKTYFAIPVQNIKAKTAGGYTIQHTGETKLVSGINCEKIIATGASTVTEMWVTKDFTAPFYRFASFFKTDLALQVLSEAKLEGFPVSSVTRDLNGNVTSSSELVSASTTDLADAEFKIPAEYKSAAEVSKAKK
ncbi:MAG TPA: DUF4412 domain-containing protein [Chitinophagales bacterium]|nr:DUF4412 domain-containing protein [Chitinophagales bacterium]